MLFRGLAGCFCILALVACTVTPEDLPGAYESSYDGSRLVVKEDGTATVTQGDIVKHYDWRMVDNRNQCTRLEFLRVDEDKSGDGGFLPCAHWSFQGGAVITHGSEEYYIKSED